MHLWTGVCISIPFHVACNKDGIDVLGFECLCLRQSTVHVSSTCCISLHKPWVLSFYFFNLMRITEVYHWSFKFSLITNNGEHLLILPPAIYKCLSKILSTFSKLSYWFVTCFGVFRCTCLISVLTGTSPRFWLAF